MACCIHNLFSACSNTIELFEASDFADKYETLTEAKQDKDWNTFSRSKIDKIKKEFESREDNFDVYNILPTNYEAVIAQLGER